MHIVKSTCPRDCYDTCFIRVVKEDDVIKSVYPDPENPLTDGFLCPRGVSDNVWVYVNRVLYPHIRLGSKPTNNFKRVTWKEAISTIVNKLKYVLDNYGPKSVLHLEYAGNMDLITWYFPQRFWNLIGATRSDYSICSKSGHEGISLHYGLSYGVLPQEISNMKLIILWGFNAAVSAPHLWNAVLRARRNGGTVIAIDPRNSETARSSDLWIQVKPGSDVWLGYGIARLLIEKELIDREFIDRYTFGFKEFIKEVMKYDLKEVSEITGVNEKLISRVSELYGSIRPSVIMIGLGVQKSMNGAEVTRILSLLPALVGQHRGFYYSNSRGFYIDTAYLSGDSLLKDKVRTVSQVALAKHILNGEFKFIYIYNMNPLLTLPGQRYLREGLLRDDVFVVTHTTHWNESCHYSDIVLPAPTYLEKDGLVIPYSHNYVRISKKVIEPLGESRDEVWVVKELANGLGIRSRLIYEDPWEALRIALEHAIDGSFDDLLSGKTVMLRYRPKDEYQTPTQRIEFYSLSAHAKGINPLPKPVITRHDAREFVLINSSTPLYTHTQFWEVYGEPKPLIHISPYDAKELGINDGCIVRVCSDEDCVSLIAKVDNSLQRRTLWVQRQIKDLNGKPINSITPIITQTVGGGPIFNSINVSIHVVKCTSH